MRRIVIGLVCALGTLFVCVPAAEAKGLSSVTITGGSLEAPIVLTADSSLTAQQMMHIADAARMYEHADPQSAKVAGESGAAELGPEFVVTYVDGARGTTFVQHLYPFARPKPVGFAPSQETWDGQRTQRGWVESTQDLPSLLVGLGVAAPEFTRAERPDRTSAPLGFLMVAGLAAAAVIAPTAHRRHRKVAELRGRSVTPAQ